MGILPHHFLCDHTQLWDFSEFKHEFLEKIFIWPFELILLGGGVLLPFDLEFEFLCVFFHECKVGLILAHFLTEGSDKKLIKIHIKNTPNGVTDKKIQSKQVMTTCCFTSGCIL